ncbi:DUF5694 domain-containing protein [Hymenobacter lapidiphilus]|uniref:TraB/GumN family protein n=1 Tax=Hymenobacter lapidiphilus TaxID=2608003 RepID=A0A7Y7U676_9BACT|nr:DUF5694 domain-containing protein [Hymenobacter lapidiphilus]NVO31484.1 hypothetical protein [Hymenobacter lapidiphilus]
MLHRAFLFVLLALTSLGARAQTKPAELLLIGTFHYDNPGLDLTKVTSVDVLAPKGQADLEMMATKIAAFGPKKVFVEWQQNDQATLDELYAHYRKGEYESYIRSKYTDPRKLNLFLKNEMFQLGFRTAKKANLPRVYGIDYQGTSFPFDSVQQAIRAAGQTAIQQRIDAALKKFGDDFNRKASTMTLRELMLDANTPADLTANKGLYLDIFNRAGAVDNYAGPYLVSEWYRRNLYMYSVVQKLTEPADDKVMVLVGSGHAAIIRDFVPYDPRFRLRELREVLK